MTDRPTPATLFHVHDPMCSWCWAFRPASDALFTRLAERADDRQDANHLTVRGVLGGLAPDSAEPMPAALAERLQATWRRIADAVPGTRFNHAFWSDNTPRRSTWLACRAVLAAESLDASPATMTDAIQQAYYLEARNPSDAETLVALAERIGLDGDRFAERLASADVEQALQADFRTCEALGARGFPSLYLQDAAGRVHDIPVDFGSPDAMLDAIDARLAGPG